MRRLTLIDTTLIVASSQGRPDVPAWSLSQETVALRFFGHVEIPTHFDTSAGAADKTATEPGEPPFCEGVSAGDSLQLPSRTSIVNASPPNWWGARAEVVSAGAKAVSCGR